LLFVFFSLPFFLIFTMFLSYHSLSSFLYSRPPLAMFIFSLLALSVTTLSLALYCRSSPKLHNVDVLDWNRLFTEMSDIKYCLKTNSTPSAETSNTTTYTATMANVSIKSNLVAFLPRDSQYFSGEGSIPLAHLGLGHTSEESVRVKLQQERGQATVCVRVESEQVELIEHLRNDTVGNDACIDNARETPEFVAHSDKHLPHSWCKINEGTVFQWDFEEREDWATFLTQEEREVMYVHLLATSAVLASVVVSMLLWAAARGAAAGNRRVGDRRGDMMLLPSEGQEEERDF